MPGISDTAALNNPTCLHCFRDFSVAVRRSDSGWTLGGRYTYPAAQNRHERPHPLPSSIRTLLPNSVSGVVMVERGTFCSVDPPVAEHATLIFSGTLLSLGRKDLRVPSLWYSGS